MNNIERTDDNLIAKAFGKNFSYVTVNLEAELHQTSLDPLSLIQVKPETTFLIQYLPPNMKKIKSLKNTKIDTNTLPIRNLKFYIDIFSP